MVPFGSKDDLCSWLGRSITDFIEEGSAPARSGAVGVGFAGLGNPEKGVVYYAPNVGRFRDIEVGRHLRRSVGLPVVVENDANCAAIGEYWRGAARGARSLFMFTVGTGVGGCLVIGGEVWHGADGIAGEIGHTVVAAGGPVCNCGVRGCLEALVSATAIVRAYRGPARRGRRSGAGLDSGKESGPMAAKAVFDRARQGDRRASQVIDRAARALGLGIANVFHLLNPEIILVGGGVSRAGSALLGPAIDEARRAIHPSLRARLTVKRATLGDDAGLLGAAQLALREVAS
jgi:glucokinase